MIKGKTPLYDALTKHRYKSKWSFHVPGHKNGTFGFSEDEAFASVLPIDVTELTGLDDLHEPEGVIKEAQELTATLYGVNHSYFLVGGSTVGNLVMLLSSFQEGDVVLIQRNCHKSVLNGLELAGLQPVFLAPEIDPIGQFATGLTVQHVEKALRDYPEAKGILLTNPNYYGVAVDLKEIIQFMHERDLLVLVDEAHGAHLGRDFRFPDSAIAEGADMVVHSAHKTLPAMTMGAYLHSNSFRVDEKRVKHYLQVLQSSSPSYPIMASLDWARGYLEGMTKEDFDFTIQGVMEFREALSRVPDLEVLKAPEGCRLDPLKVTVQSRWGLTGYELQRKLEQHGIYTELADPNNVLFVLPLGGMKDIGSIMKSIEEALRQDSSQHVTLHRTVVPKMEAVSALGAAYKEMAYMASETALLSNSKGRIAAESVIPYPPGIPLIARGERITPAMIKEYHYLSEQGARFHGGHDHKINVYIEQKEE